MGRQPVKRCFIAQYETANPQEANALREALGVVVESDPAAPGLTPAPIRRFTELGVLPAWLTQGLADNKWETPMPIQAQALPILLAGRNLIGIAQTGSGKTLAFLIPMVVHCSEQKPLSTASPGPVGLVLAPTRELAVQISDQAEIMLRNSQDCPGHSRGLRSMAFYGGGKKWDQLRNFTHEGTHIVVATPGRLLDFVGDDKVSLKRVTALVLDEADRMLELGFRGDMEQIASAIRPERQTAFFSATWSKEIQGVASTFATEMPVTIRVGQAAGAGQEGLTARKGITQQVVVVDFPEEKKPWEKQEQKKREILEEHIKKALADEEAKMILFVNSKVFADELCEKLYEGGIFCDTLHGGRPQEKRLWVLDQFRKGRTQLLIATDVMGRGLDVEGVTHVVVFEMGGVEDYIHRIGRTGRGKDGKGHALVFFEFSDKHPDWAKELIEVLEKSEQPVPPELRKIAADVAAGKRGWSNGWSSGGSWGGRGGWKRDGWADRGSGGGRWEDRGSQAESKSISSEQIATAKAGEQFVAWDATALKKPPVVVVE